MGAQSVKLYLRAPGACTYSIHTCRCAETDSEQFLLDPCYTLCHFWLSERGRDRSRGVAPATPFSPLGEPLTANDVQHKYMCVSSENYLSNSQGASSACPHVEVVKCMLLTACNTSSDFVKLNLHRNTQRRDHYHTNIQCNSNYYSRSLNNIEGLLLHQHIPHDIVQY